MIKFSKIDSFTLSKNRFHIHKIRFEINMISDHYLYLFFFYLWKYGNKCTRNTRSEVIKYYTICQNFQSNYLIFLIFNLKKYIYFIRCSPIWLRCLFDLLITLLIDRIMRPFDQNRSGPKADLSGSKKHVLRAKKHMLFWTRVVHFWTRIWSGQGDGIKAGSEGWDDSNSSSGDGSKGRCSDRLLAYKVNNIINY